VQDFPGGIPRPLGSERVLLSHLQGFPISPDGKWIAAIGLDERLTLYSAEDGRVEQLPFLPPGCVPIRWLNDGRSLLVYRMDQQPLRVLKVDVSAGQVRAFLEIRVQDADGLQGFPSVRFTPDGRGYAYSYARFLDDLYVVKGID